MARVAVTADLGTSLSNGRFVVTAGRETPAPAHTDVAAALAVLVADGASPTEAHVTDLDDAVTALNALNTVEALYRVFEAAVAVLVADGASPTEAHVTDADAAYTAYLAAAGAAAIANDAVLAYNDSVVNTQNKVKAVLEKLFQAARDAGLST